MIILVPVMADARVGGGGSRGSSAGGGGGAEYGLGAAAAAAAAYANAMQQQQQYAAQGALGYGEHHAPMHALAGGCSGALGSGGGCNGGGFMGECGAFAFQQQLGGAGEMMAGHMGTAGLEMPVHIESALVHSSQVRCAVVSRLRPVLR